MIWESSSILVVPSIITNGSLFVNVRLIIVFSFDKKDNSFGTSEYVDPIINIIEKKEKYFEYRLYRQHAKIDGNNFIKDLNYLGRDIKKIIIVDNMPQAFKLHKKNGICIKGFYGDVVSDRNTLKILSIILEKIRFDADESKDIRDSLKKEENDIFSKITFNDDY